MSAFYAVLERYTLADLVKNREQLATVLFAEPSHGVPLRARRSA
jgi:hypothetical protein